MAGFNLVVNVPAGALCSPSPTPIHLKPQGNRPRAVLVAREDVGAEAKVAVVGEGDGLLVGLEGSDAHHLRGTGMMVGISIRGLVVIGCRA